MKLWREFRAFIKARQEAREQELIAQIIKCYEKHEKFSSPISFAWEVIYRVRDHDQRGIR